MWGPGLAPPKADPRIGTTIAERKREQISVILRITANEAHQDTLPTTWRIPDTMKKPYSHKQGQYLAFIYSYIKVHQRAPAELDIQEYFRVSPPSVHDMILRLEEHGLIRRVPGQARSIQLVIPPEELPALE
jgi:LexA DNA binding domain